MGGDNLLIISGKHGNQKFEVQLSPQCTVAELCSIIEKETSLPVQYQKIIHNGRVLNSDPNDLTRELKIFGLKSPAKVIVLGKKPDEEDDKFKTMKKWEASCDAVEKQLSSIQQDVNDLQKGYAPKQFIEENIPKLGKKINCLAEELMRIMFSLDGLTFTETQKEARAKRKCIIDRIHVLHKTCDHLSASIKTWQEEKN